MKLLLLLGLLTAVRPLTAQNVAIGERVPEWKLSGWMGEKPARNTHAVLLSFFHSASRPTVEALGRLDAIARKHGERVRVVVLVRESPEKVEPLLRSHLGPAFYVAYDDRGRTFSAYDVQFVPFAVLTDAKGRALWQGNPLTLGDEALRNLLNP